MTTYIDHISRRFKFQVPTATTSSDPQNSTAQDQCTVGSGGNNSEVPKPPTVEIFYRNQFHDKYKLDEDALRKIIKNHVLEVQVNLKLVIYYKSPKVKNLVMKNNLCSLPMSNGEKSHLIYEFRCQEGQCAALNNSYIGMTNCTLKNRLTRHKYQGAIFSHFRVEHAKNPDVETLLNFTEIIYFCDHPVLLPIIEALFIRKNKPNLNCKNEYLGLNID